MTDDIPEADEEWFKQAKLRLPRSHSAAEIGWRELWFIYSPIESPWGGLRVATFSKAINAPHLDLVVIHNETDRNRFGIRVWDDIVQSEMWFKIRQIAIPSEDEIAQASEKYTT
jgi:hypothetical protein